MFKIERRDYLLEYIPDQNCVELIERYSDELENCATKKDGDVIDEYYSINKSILTKGTYRDCKHSLLQDARANIYT